MNAPPRKDDLIVVVPDSHVQATINSLLVRHESLGIRPISFRVQPFSRRDPGCLRESHDLLRSFRSRFDFAMVMFDRHGSGQEHKSREELEREVEEKLQACGWKNAACAVVFDPELEIWVWSDSREVDNTLGWAGGGLDMRSWLTEHEFLSANEDKPRQPKKAMHAALRQVGKPPSASLFRDLAARVSLRRCVDPAFAKLKSTLQGWFPG